VDIAENRSGGPQKHDRYIQVGDVRTRYRMAGEGEPAILLIHGLGASLESWENNLEALARRRRTMALDVVWFGKSDKPTHQVTRDYFADFIAGFMDAEGVSSAVLVGNSMGGMIAVMTALQYPNRVAGLVLVSSAGFGRELAWWLRLRAAVPIGQIVGPSLSLYRYAVHQLVYDPGVVKDELVQVFMEMAKEPGAMDANRRVLKSGVDWRGVKPVVLDEIREAARTIRAPTLIIWGKQDRVVPVAHAEIARQYIPHARLHVFDRCGHAPMIEKADEFNKLVSEFVSENIAPLHPPLHPIREAT
jgi:pimeloyl-ACP methyl ester carboxylesterase